MIMNKLTLKKKEASIKTVKLEHYVPIFITNDGVEHVGSSGYKSIIPNRVDGVQSYLTMCAFEQKYLLDENDWIYPISNIKCMKWVLDRSRIVIDDESIAYKTMLSATEEEKLVDYVENKEE